MQGSQGLGISITGGRDQMLIEGDPGIFITKIVENGTEFDAKLGSFRAGAAQRDGRLAVGDQLLQVDGADLTNVEHGVCLCGGGVDDDVQVAVMHLKQAKEDIKLRVSKNAVQAAKRRLNLPESVCWTNSFLFSFPLSSARVRCQHLLSKALQDRYKPHQHHMQAQHPQSRRPRERRSRVQKWQRVQQLLSIP